MKTAALLLLTTLGAVWSHAQDSISVLFIGNSYTYANDLPEMTRQLALSNGRILTVDSKTNGGYTLQNQCADPLTFQAMHEQSWDVVVLQAQSQEPCFPDAQVDANTIPYAIQLADSVHATNPCSNVLYYMTWGRENGDPQWGPIATFDGMNQRLYNAYLRMADSTDAMVSAVGAVWKFVRDHYPAIDLYVADGSHPSVAGTYLAACTFYTSLFLEPVSGAPYFAGLDAQTAGQLQLAADQVVLDSLEQFRLHAVDEPVQARFDFFVNGNDVQFTNTSTREETVSWDFGDGASSADQDPVHNYAGTGPFDVVLTASNECAVDSTHKLVQLNLSELVNLANESFELLEFQDYFLVRSLTKTLYLEIHTFDNKSVISNKILTTDFQQISKISNQGIISLKNEQGQLFVRKYVTW